MPPNKVCVYYSPFGGAGIAVLEDPDGDAAYERTLDRQGVAWEKVKASASDIPKTNGAYDPSKVKVKDGRVEAV